jgi:hypothetical protein
MPFKPEDKDLDFPPALRLAIHDAQQKIRKDEITRLNTPVPGNPQGGFPGFRAIGKVARDARKDLIDKWNAEHPDGDS